MTETRVSAGRHGRIMIGVAIGLMLVGFVAVMLSLGCEWHGFGGGFAVGAGIGAMLVGAYFWGWTNGLRRPAQPSRWLPSEDAGR